MSAMLITPICPHMLTNRPIVLPDYVDVEVAIATQLQEIFLTLDGQEGLALTEHDRVCVKKSQATVLFEQSPGKERSEEHTSELQSPDHLVCRLLLEKKKN